MDTFFLYLILRLDAIKDLLVVMQFLLLFPILIVFGTFFAGAIQNDGTTEKEKALQRANGLVTSLSFRFAVFLVFCFFGLQLLLPTTKQMTAIYIVPKIVNNDRIQGIAEGSVDILESLLKDYLNDLTKTVEQETE